MMIRTLSLAATILGLASLPVMAQASAEQKAAIAAAIEANGCRVTAENNSTILAAAGLAEADAATVVQALIDAEIQIALDPYFLTPAVEVTQ